MHTYTAEDGLKFKATSKVYEDRAGRILAGTVNGVDVLVGDRFESFYPVPRQNALPIGENRSGDLFVHLIGESFTLRVQGSRAENVREFESVAGIVETDSGELWFGMFGVHRVVKDGLMWSRPHDEPLDQELFGTQDGLPAMGVSAGNPSMAVAGDGAVWAATGLGLVRFDPQRLPSTDDPVTIYVRQVTVGRETRPAPHELSLSPGTSHVEIDFAAVEISSSEKIRMQ